MIFDTHAHYDDEAFDDDREKLLERMQNRGVEYIVNVGASMSSCKSTIGLVRRFPYVYGALGVHPDEVSELTEEDYQWLKKSIYKPKITKKFKIKYSGKNWNLLRDKILKRDVKCRVCSSEENLHCHHSYYMPGRNIWEYPESSFMILCENCHTEFHEKIKGKDLVIRGENNIKLKIKEEEFLGFYYNKS